MLNLIWLGLIVAGVIIGGATGRLKEVADGSVKGAETAVTIALGLIGVMTVWLGIMRLAERSGFILVLSRALRPALRRLFPEVPIEHPAMGSMVMNIAANMLGLVNAATPLGLRAMRDLDKLNPHPGTATNAMCTFLAINTGSVQLIPITAIAVLAAAGSQSPYSIVGTSLLATACSCTAGLIAVKTFEKLGWFDRGKAEPVTKAATEEQKEIISVATDLKPMNSLRGGVLLLLGLFFLLSIALASFPETFGLAARPGQTQQGTFVRVVNGVSIAAIPFLVLFFPLYGFLRGLKVYEEFVEGAKEGFNVAIRIIPYLVAMLLAISIFRGGGGIELLTRALGSALRAIQFPPELLPMALMRPLSGSGSLAIFSYIVCIRDGARILQMGALLSVAQPLTWKLQALNPLSPPKGEDQGEGRCLTFRSSHDCSPLVTNTEFPSLFHQYLRHGVAHIMSGYDHLLFIIALVLAAATFWDLLKVVTAFTIAHTVTLALSVLNIVRLPSSIVEPMIAGSIVFVALTNVFWPQRSRGWTRTATAFFFGLFHGLGFAGGLLNATDGMTGMPVLLAITAFSLGAELGHQMVVLPFFSILKLARATRSDDAARDRFAAIAARGGSLMVSVAGIFYLIAALR